MGSTSTGAIMGSTSCRTVSGFTSFLVQTQGCPTKVGQPWAALHNPFGVKDGSSVLSGCNFLISTILLGWLCTLGFAQESGETVKKSAGSRKAESAGKSEAAKEPSPEQ